jgi:hypothetical protein
MAKEKMTDAKLAALLEQALGESSGFSDSYLSKERQLVQLYYDGDRPLPSHKGNSKYVSLDVYDKVEGMKASLLETFAAGNRIGLFEPQGAGDVENCRIATDVCDYVVFRKNAGYDIFHDVIHDGLTARIGVAKVHWEVIKEVEEEEFTDISDAEFVGLVSQENVELAHEPEAVIGPDGLYRFTGTIKRTVEKKQVRIEPLAPEEFGVQARAKNLDDGYAWHKKKVTKSQLRKMDYDKKKIEEACGFEDAWVDDIETQIRHQEVDNKETFESWDSATQKAWFYEFYIDLDIEGEGVTSLYKVCKVGNTILSKEKVRRKPFIVFVPLRRPHSVYGSNYANKVVATQNARTVLVRGILDHTVTTNNPRYKVVKGSLTRPEELLDNRVGGIVNVTRPDGVLPLEQSGLNPFVFQTIQLLDYDAEESTGLSQLSQGLNKDAVSKQNSAAMVEQLTSLSMTRQKIIARNFANQFLKPLYELVYELMLENADEAEFMDVAGNVATVDITKWREKRNFVVQLKLGYGEREREAEKWLATDAFLRQTGSPFYGKEQQYNLMRRVFEAREIKDVDSYLMRPEQVQPPQPDPLAMAEVQLKLAQAEAAKANAQANLLKLQMEQQQMQAKTALDAKKLQVETALKADKLDLEERQQAHAEEIDNAELALAEKAQEVRAIASPDPAG